MKETNLETLCAAVEELIDTTFPTILEQVDRKPLIYTVMNIYLNIETSCSVTNHIKGSFTIIATQKSVSVIDGEAATRYQLRQPLCIYEDVYDDVTTILSCIEICFLRLIDE